MWPDFCKKIPNCKSGKIKLILPVDSYTTVNQSVENSKIQFASFALYLQAIWYLCIVHAFYIMTRKYSDHCQLSPLHSIINECSIRLLLFSLCVDKVKSSLHMNEKGSLVTQNYIAWEVPLLSIYSHYSELEQSPLNIIRSGMHTPNS